MIDYCLIGGEKIYVGDIVEYNGRNIKLFNESQCHPKYGKYRLEIINLNLIDVVYKGIANRDFFKFDSFNETHIDNIKKNFEKTHPIILEKLSGRYYSIDGHHRITAAIELGLSNILSFVISVDKLSYPRN